MWISAQYVRIVRIGHSYVLGSNTRWLRLPDHTAECKECQGDPILEEKRKLTKQRETGKTDQGLGKNSGGKGEILMVTFDIDTKGVEGFKFLNPLWI